MAAPTVLKALLTERHLQEHRAFVREYDRVAKRLDSSLIGNGPSKATFYRWLAGGVNKLPYPGHCRVLEAMFQGGWAAAQLFEPWTGDEPPAVRRTTNEAAASTTAAANMADVTAVFNSRTEFVREMPPDNLFDAAHRIRIAGLSLNILCQQYPEHKIRALLDSGAKLECLFLDPDGGAINQREREEGFAAGHLSMLTRLNMQVIERIRDQVDADSRSRLQMNTYDETIRFNITLVDDRTCIAQPYLPGIRGVDSPTFVAEKRPNMPGLYATFEQMFNSLWESSKPQ